ncbi:MULTISPECIES: hypothetical protein [Bacillus subtilis group]|uniref:Uncharacterized protein n=1 Tax=Bacillus halotolerans TaxID=260554 RepID=A0ABY7HZM5_9BACI|nr:MULTISPECIES: hypothetical protein [Bacillus subtilis group]MDG0765224.1 hypothetical protein [Bacillus halotolerans]NDK00608.1 hypothetical protein [Bacillus subtilis subsp. subtilis]WAT20450.1 hypothetical protein O0R52_15990 [Bacillus halotolerans]
MIVALKIVLLLVVVISLMGVIGEEKDLQLRSHLTAICIAAIIGNIVTYVLL